MQGNFASCYVDEENIPADFLDERYQTKSAQLSDAGYRLWNKGVLLESGRAQILQQQQLPKPTLKDEYIFVRKYWGTGWATFAMILRVFTFKNIFKELPAYFSTQKISRINTHHDPVQIKEYEAFQSQLIRSKPLVAVIIPTLNRYRWLKQALLDLQRQTYQNFEVLVFDQSENFDENFYKEFSLHIKLYRQKHKLLWTARNNAVKATNARYLLFFDDDSRVEPGWIEAHLKCIDFFNADISAGVSIATTGQKVSASYGYFRWADQFDSGNAMVKRNVFEKIGLFDEQFNGMRSGDAEFGLRAYMNGFKSISDPNAFRIHLKVSIGGLREMGSWDGFRPKKWFAPKPVPSVIYLLKKYFPPALYRNSLLIGMMLSNIPYKQKRSSAMLMLSVFITIVKAPLLLVQYFWSLKIAGRMLANDYKPELLKQ